MARDYSDFERQQILPNSRNVKQLAEMNPGKLSARIALELQRIRSGGLEPISKIVDWGSEQGAGWRKSGAYTVVCEHFEPFRNAALDP
jgi:hypothetical protein